MTKTNVQMYERMTFDAAGAVRFTTDGYLCAEPKIARTGIQMYSGAEVGMPDKDQVRVYRPEDEVFHKDALHSLAHKPITLDHPEEAVTAKNWKKLAVGYLDGHIARDGEFIRIPMMLTDETAISAWKGGQKELSVGYMCELDWTPGKTKDGKDYDAIQRNIRANHLAVVAAARGGSELRIGDDNRNGDRQMAMKTMKLDGLTVELSDASAEILAKYIQTTDAKIATMESDAKKVGDQIATLTTELNTAKKTAETKDAEIATLKTQVEKAKMTPDAIDAMVKDRAETIAKAKAFLGDKLVIQGKSGADIKKQVVLAELGDVAKDWTADQITTSFATLTAKAEVSGGSNGRGNGSGAPVYDAAQSFSQPGYFFGNDSKGDIEKEKAYAEMCTNLSDAWKPESMRTKKSA